MRQERDRLARLVVAESEGRPDQKSVSSGGFCANVRRRDARVGGGTSPSRKGFWTTFRGGEIVHTHGASYARVAAPTDGVIAVHPRAHGEVTSHQRGLNGVRVGEASHPGPRLFQGGRRVLE